MINGNRPRVFVSSIIDGFQEERNAAKRAIEKVGYEPLLVENLPSSPDSSRNLCLDSVENSDAIVLILGTRGGFVNELTGKLVVEEEFEQAKKKGIPVILFCSIGEFDSNALRLKKKISDYVKGHFRREYTSIYELEKLVESGVQGLLLKSKENSPNLISQHFGSQGETFNNVYKAFKEDSPILRTAILPVREESILPIVDFADEKTKNKMYTLAIAAGLFCHEKEKNGKHSVSGWTLQQPVDFVEIKVFENGMITIDLEIIEEGSESFFGNVSEVTEEEIKAALASSFNFMKAFYNEFDSSQRHVSFYLGAGIKGMRNKKIVTRRSNSNNFTISMDSFRDQFVMGTQSGEIVPRQSLCLADTAMSILTRMKIEQSSD